MSKYISIIFIFVCAQLNAQSIIRGQVLVNDAEMGYKPLPFASVYSEDKLLSTLTDSIGFFQLESKTLPIRIVVSMVGYTNDTVTGNNTDMILRVVLKPGKQLKEIVVQGKQEGLKISTLQLINTEVITSKELLRAACCNLSESFETNPSVSINYTDAITGAKEIQLLGLSGIYTQLLNENISSMNGLAQAYGLGYVPGPWMESIQINKGAGSVVNGYDALAGSINIEYIKPEEAAEKAYINLFASQFGETETNFYTIHKLNEHLSTMMMLHTEYFSQKRDHNDDGFLDMPMKQQVNFYNRWRYHSGKKLEGQFGIKALAELREGGQKEYFTNENKDKLFFGSQIKTNRVEMYTKTGMVFPEHPNKSLGLQMNYVYHKMNSFFGLKKYDAIQNSYNANLIYMNELWNCNNKIKAGASFRYMNIDGVYQHISDNFSIGNYEIVPGIFAEYNYKPNEQFAVIAGGRADYHNEFGMFYTGRMNAKYNFTENFIVRVAGGNSFRTANIIADNIGLMADGKRLLPLEDLLPERAWNYGINTTYKFIIAHREGSLNIDAYRTEFVNQVIIDPYTDRDFIQLYNLKGESYAQSFSIAINYNLFPRLDMRLAYKLDDVHITYFETEIEKPLIGRHKGLFNLGYESINKKWRVDYTIQIVGSKKIALQAEGHHGGSTFQTSPIFTLMNGQVTKVFRKFELYAGVENATNFTQHHPIINAENPFSREFDATQIWGPIMGRRIYAGFRMKII